jgi:S-disulfanyl-L-cysteine oxidoreductase SoxD
MTWRVVSLRPWTTWNTKVNADESTITVPNYWPYATSVYDYVRRAMPWQSPRSTSDQEAWDLTAFILEKNHLIPPNSTTTT